MNNALNLAKSRLVESIWKSAKLEGLNITLADTQNILDIDNMGNGYREFLFVYNMYDAWKFLFDSIGYPVDIMYLREVNRIVGEGVFIGNGVIRKHNVGMGRTKWMPELPECGKVIVKLERLSGIDDVIDRALKTFCYIARSQLFINGNKRVATLVANKILIESGVGIFQAPNDVEMFKSMLIDYYETGIDGDIIDYMKRFCIVEGK